MPGRLGLPESAIQISVPVEGAHWPQLMPASSAQVWSQPRSQQVGSAAHTVAQQSASLQPGVPFGEQQSPASGSPQEATSSESDSVPLPEPE